jgi:hypothetical protein
MAGSYKHVVTDDGNLGSNEFVVDMLETGGDVFEAVEEMYGMIWWLAAIFGAPAAPPSEVKRVVEAARQNYTKGLEIAKEVNAQSEVS